LCRLATAMLTRVVHHRAAISSLLLMRIRGRWIVRLARRRIAITVITLLFNAKIVSVWSHWSLTVVIVVSLVVVALGRRALMVVAAVIVVVSRALVLLVRRRGRRM